MPVFFEKETHVMIQLESDQDWVSFQNSCEGYLTPYDFKKIYEYLSNVALTVVLEKGYAAAILFLII